MVEYFSEVYHPQDTQDERKMLGCSNQKYENFDTVD